MTDETDREKLARRVKAIIAKAEHGATEGEALSFMEKARQLMEEAGLSLDEVENAGDPLELQREAGGMAMDWRASLFDACARYWRCEVVFSYRSGSRRGKVHLGGRRSAIVVLKEMWPYIVKSVGREASRARARGELYGSQEKARADVGRALAYRISKLVREREAGERLGGGPGLVVVDQVSALMKEEFGQLETMRRKNTAQKGARAVADRISLDDQLKGGGSGGDQKMIGR